MKSNQKHAVSSPVNNSEKMTKNSGKCILIYDDNHEILLMCKTILKRDRYRVETLTRCENVIDDIDRIKPDLILMDLWIPEIGGEKAVGLIKDNPETQHVPVLLFSANDKIAEICKKTKADGYISKLFDLHTFKETIARNI